MATKETTVSMENRVRREIDRAIANYEAAHDYEESMHRSQVINMALRYVFGMELEDWEREWLETYATLPSGTSELVESHDPPTEYDPEAGDFDTTGQREPDETDIIDSILEGWRPGRTSEEREPRLVAGRAALEFLQEQGEAEKSEFIEALYDDYAPDNQGEDTFWRKVVRGDLDEGTGALGSAIEAGYVERERGPPHLYRWITE